MLQDGLRPDDRRIPGCFYLKMKNDYHRYLAESKCGGDRKDAAEATLSAYKADSGAAVAATLGVLAAMEYWQHMLLEEIRLEDDPTGVADDCRCSLDGRLGGGNFTAGGADGFPSSDQDDINLDGKPNGGYGGYQDGPLDDFKVSG